LGAAVVALAAALAGCAAPLGEPDVVATPTPTPAPTPVPLPIELVSVTESVARNGTAKVAVLTAPQADCSIEVRYDSGPSQAQGLGPKVTDEAGAVDWSWKIGFNTNVGPVPIVISCTDGERTGTLRVQLRVS
jgi:hypothetical protein